jgi:hypothetical protein
VELLGDSGSDATRVPKDLSENDFQLLAMDRRDVRMSVQSPTAGVCKVCTLTKILWLYIHTFSSITYQTSDFEVTFSRRDNKHQRRLVGESYCN